MTDSTIWKPARASAVQPAAAVKIGPLATGSACAVHRFQGGYRQLPYCDGQDAGRIEELADAAQLVDRCGSERVDEHDGVEAATP